MPCRLWGSFWARKQIVAFCDNAAIVEAINKGRSFSISIMPFLHCITWHSVIKNFIPSACHIPGHSNTIAGTFSRLQFQIFCRLCPSADLLPTPVPPFEDLSLNDAPPVSNLCSNLLNFTLKVV
uniref:PPUP7297 n=1 Tax=Poeciliopsis prolifica TaxID=188132 RepID=A0A0S7ERI7_9TELE